MTIYICRHFFDWFINLRSVKKKKKNELIDFRFFEGVNKIQRTVYRWTDEKLVYIWMTHHIRESHFFSNLSKPLCTLWYWFHKDCEDIENEMIVLLHFERAITSCYELLKRERKRARCTLLKSKSIIEVKLIEKRRSKTGILETWREIKSTSKSSFFFLFFFHSEDVIIKLDHDFGLCCLRPVFT